MSCIRSGSSACSRSSRWRWPSSRSVSPSAIFATVSGLLGGWIALLTNLPWTPDGHLPVADLYRGIGESLTVGFVSFGLLAATWMLVAVGVLRRGHVDVG